MADTSVSGGWQVFLWLIHHTILIMVPQPAQSKVRAKVRDKIWIRAWFVKSFHQ